ncbi:MAG: HEAT repeat domain-containing protein [Bradymonadaceae bacterium]|nr:HEAT repeat domain-containing protein [Lujinxingiaceae bacterium]
MRKLILATVLAAVTGLGMPAFAQQQDDDARFESVLRAIDTTPSGAELEHHFHDAAERLIAAATDDLRDLFTRTRAIAMLANFARPDTRATLVGLTTDARAEIRRAAYYTLALAFGQPGDDALLATLARGTKDEQLEVRLHTVRALRWVQNDGAQKLLESLTHDAHLGKLATRTLERRTQSAAQ